MTERPKASSRTLVIAVTALALVVALLLLVSGDPEPDKEAPTAATPQAAPSQTPTPTEPEASPSGTGAREAPSEGEDEEPDPRPIIEGSGPGPHTLPSGGTLILHASSLPSDRPVVLSLALPEEAKMKGGASHPIRVMAPDDRVLHANAAADAVGVRLEIGADWLLPGRYIVEVKTAERTHFPLRRYAIEIR